MISGKRRKEQQCCRQRYEPLLQMVHTLVKKAVVRRQRLASFLLQFFFRESLRFLFSVCFALTRRQPSCRWILCIANCGKQKRRPCDGMNDLLKLLQQIRAFDKVKERGILSRRMIFSRRKPKKDNCRQRCA